MTRISPAELEDLKARTDLAALVAGDHPDLRKAGHVWTGPCPFCGGGKRGTRFFVKPAQKVWGCAVCGAGGDAIEWIMQTRGLEFRDAVAELGGPRALSEEERAKLDRESDKRAREEARRAQKQLDKALAIWGQSQPLGGEDGGGTYGLYYFQARGIPFENDGDLPASLRFHPALDYWWSFPDRPPRVIQDRKSVV